MGIPVTDRNRALLNVLDAFGDDLADASRKAIEDAARELTRPVGKFSWPSEHYLNPAKLPLPPADYEALLMRIDSKATYVDELLGKIPAGVEIVKGHLEDVGRDEIGLRVATAIVDLYLHTRYARMHLAAKHG